MTAASKKPPQYKEEDDKDVEDSCNNDNYNPNKFTQNKNHHQSDNGDDNTNIQGDGDEAGKHANKSSDHKSLTYEQYRVLLFKYENSNLVLEAMRQDDKVSEVLSFPPNVHKLERVIRRSHGTKFVC